MAEKLTNFLKKRGVAPVVRKAARGVISPSQYDDLVHFLGELDGFDFPLLIERLLPMPDTILIFTKILSEVYTIPALQLAPTDKNALFIKDSLEFIENEYVPWMRKHRKGRTIAPDDVQSLIMSVSPLLKQNSKLFGSDELMTAYSAALFATTGLLLVKKFRVGSIYFQLLLCHAIQTNTVRTVGSIKNYFNSVPQISQQLQDIEEFHSQFRDNILKTIDFSTIYDLHDYPEFLSEYLGR